MARFLYLAWLLLVVVDVGTAQPLSPRWRREFAGQGRLIGVERSGQCVAVADRGVMQVLRPTGEVWWTWPYAKISRHIKPFTGAIAPGCNAVTIDGGVGYRYVWIVRRGGASVSVRTSGTPLHSAFDHAGKRVGIGTGAGVLQIHTLDGTLIWKAEPDVPLVSEFDFSSDDQYLVMTGWGGAGVVRADGRVMWSFYANRATASRDLSTFVIGREPNHGPGLPAFFVADGSGREEWMRWGPLEVFVSDTGHRILAAVDVKQEKAEEDFLESLLAPNSLQLLDRGGKAVTAFAGFDKPLAMSGDATRLWLRAKSDAGPKVIVCVDDGGRRLAELISSEWDSKIYFGRRSEYVVVAYDHYERPAWVEWYDVPTPCRQ